MAETISDPVKIHCRHSGTSSAPSRSRKAVDLEILCAGARAKAWQKPNGDCVQQRLRSVSFRLQYKSDVPYGNRDRESRSGHPLQLSNFALAEFRRGSVDFADM